jgi:hypothetical protein
MLLSSSSRASIGRLGARAAVVAIVAIALAASAAALVPGGDLRPPAVQAAPVHLLIPNKPPPVNGYRGPNGPVCRRICVGSGGGGSPQRPQPCQWQTVCN